MAPALAALLLLAPAAAAAAAGNASSSAGLGAVERGLVQDAQPAAWAKECLGYWQATDSLPNPDSPATYLATVQAPPVSRANVRESGSGD